MSQLVQFGFLKTVGTIKLPGIKGQTAYCTRRIKSDLLPHEIGVSTAINAIARAFGEIQVARGMDVDQTFLADSEFIIRNHWHMEYDTGTERLRQVIERWDLLLGLPEDRKVLWITQTDKRKGSIMSIAHPLKDRIVFASLHEIVMTPHEVLAGEEGEQDSEGNSPYDSAALIPPAPAHTPTHRPAPGKEQPF